MAITYLAGECCCGDDSGSQTGSVTGCCLDVDPESWPAEITVRFSNGCGCDSWEGLEVVLPSLTGTGSAWAIDDYTPEGWTVSIRVNVTCTYRQLTLYGPLVPRWLITMVCPNEIGGSYMEGASDWFDCSTGSMVFSEIVAPYGSPACCNWCTDPIRTGYLRAEVI